MIRNAPAVRLYRVMVTELLANGSNVARPKRRPGERPRLLGGCLWRGEEDKISRLFQRMLDRRPQRIAPGCG